MSSILSAIRSVPGISFNTTRCRHPGCNETETLGHVLGFCRKTELLRTNRHHKIRTGIADVLKRRGWEEIGAAPLPPPADRFAIFHPGEPSSDPVSSKFDSVLSYTEFRRSLVYDNSREEKFGPILA
ncbi:hypothetical protein ANN_23533 [Periplaneta americana]|uniref:Uncharacterized protein n=1 Tax=Periplaneta americana TaxID=6978 RepID=A0ABQ8SMK6_PERAM|nr:hypothetical protein ANN_23533 [Periplaneta americana]